MNLEIKKYADPSKIKNNAKIFSPMGAKQYNAGQRGVTSKPFSPEWQNQVTDNVGKLMTVGSYKKGGIVKKTGLALVHKGEKVIPKGQHEKALKKMEK